jgi:hypothetical protein
MFTFRSSCPGSSLPADCGVKVRLVTDNGSGASH